MFKDVLFTMSLQSTFDSVCPLIGRPFAVLVATTLLHCEFESVLTNNAVQEEGGWVVAHNDEFLGISPD